MPFETHHHTSAGFFTYNQLSSLTSLLFGANAIGGVINVITKEPEKNSYQAKYNMSLIDGKSADNTLSLNTSPPEFLYLLICTTGILGTLMVTDFPK